MVPSKKYHVYFRTQEMFGESVITQNHYKPITPDVLEDTKRIIRENNNIPEDEKIIICYWQRYEGEEDDGRYVDPETLSVLRQQESEVN